MDPGPWAFQTDLFSSCQTVLFHSFDTQVTNVTRVKKAIDDKACDLDGRCFKGRSCHLLGKGDFICSFLEPP